MTYAVRYKIDPGEFTKEQVIAEDAGACDACVLISVVHGDRNLDPHAGPVSYAVLSLNGITKKTMIPSELFMAFAAFAYDLSQNEDLPLWQKDIAKMTHKDVKDVISVIDTVKKL